MKAILVIAILLLATPLFAQDSTDVINMAQTIDKLGNRAIDGLEQLAGQMGVTAEKAFPYAVEYVGAKRSIEWWLPAIVGTILLIISVMGWVFVVRKWEQIEEDDNEAPFVGTGIMVNLFTIFFIIMAFINFTEYWIFLHAPEAATVEYLINMVR